MKLTPAQTRSAKIPYRRNDKMFDGFKRLSEVNAELIECDSTYEPSKIIDRRILVERMKWVLQTLSYREREIIKLCYGFDDGHTHTLEEVGRIFKITRGLAKMVERKALRKLRHPVRKICLEQFLDD